MASKAVVVHGASTDAPTIDPEQTLKAAKALVQHLKQEAADDAMITREMQEGLNPLVDEDDEGASDLSETPIVLYLTTKTFVSAANHLKPHKIPLPHPLASPSSDVSICLIVADPQRSYKDVVASAEFPAALRQRIGRVIGYEKLKKKYRIFEAQRQLYASYDIFLADDRIIKRLPKILGKTFYKNTTKRPIPVVLSPLSARKGKTSRKGAPKGTGLRPQVKRGDVLSNRVGQPGAIAKEITRAIGAAPVHLSASTNTVVRVGYADWDPTDIVENVAVVARDLVERWVPRKWANVRGIYLKGPKTTSLPIWLAEKLWVDEATVNTVRRHAGEANVMGDDLLDSATKEKANTKKKRKTLDGQTLSPEKPTKKSKLEKEENAAVVQRLSASRKEKLEKEKASARTSME